MNHYMKVRWLHEHTDAPILLLNELDEERYEIRKVEVFADGRMGYAFDDTEFGGTGLAAVPVPEAIDIAADPQFIIEEITFAEFERYWENATS